MFSRLSGRAQSKSDADCYRQDCFRRFHSFSRYGLTKGPSKGLALHCCHWTITALSSIRSQNAQSECEFPDQNFRLAKYYNLVMLTRKFQQLLSTQGSVS